MAYSDFAANPSDDDVIILEPPPKKPKENTRDTPTPPTTPSPVHAITAGFPELRLLSAMVTYSVGLSPAAIERALDWFRSYRGLDQPSGN